MVGDDPYQAAFADMARRSELEPEPVAARPAQRAMDPASSAAWNKWAREVARHEIRKQLESYTDVVIKHFVERFKRVEDQQKENYNILLGVIHAAEHRVKRIERLPVLRHVGQWRPEAAYREGHLCTHKGRIWHCDSETNTEPFEGSKHWSLAALQKVAWEKCTK